MKRGRSVSQSLKTATKNQSNPIIIYSSDHHSYVDFEAHAARKVPTLRWVGMGVVNSRCL